MGTLALHLIICYFFVVKWGWGASGAAMATNITYILNLVLCEVWILRVPEIRKTYAWPDRQSFQKLGSYLKIGIPGALMLCFEWWAFELLALFSGLMGVEALAAEVVVINMVTFVFMIPLGCSYAASALTGFFLGEGKIAQAKKYAMLTLVFNSMVTLVLIVIMSCMRP